MELKVYYEDTDAGGVVYYANYLRYFERARTEYLQERGISLLDYHSQGILFPVVRLEIDYKSPARYGELLEIGTRMTHLSRASFTLEHTIKSKSDQRVIVWGITRIACLNKSGRPVKLPAELKSTIIS
ncbi:MAG: YbgC/FadM family acyl-CoA thioesterase [bacterium]